jgi:hypothetical protein
MNKSIMDKVKIQTIATYHKKGFTVMHSPVNKKWEIWKDHKFYGTFDTYHLAGNYIERHYK